MPRVLLVCEPPGGGTAENVAHLALGMRGEGFEVELAGPRRSRAFAAVEAGGIAYHRLALRPGYRNWLDDALALSGIVRLLRSGRFDLVHCHSAKAGALGRLAARIAGVPAVYSPHCFSFIGDFSANRRRVATAVERALAPTTAAYLCVCEDERRIALEHGLAPPERLHVVFNGSEPCDPTIVPDATLSALRAGGPLVATVNALREQKRVDVFLDAIPRILERVPQARAAVVGEGPLKPQLYARAAALELDREERFAFVAFDAPMSTYLRALDVFVLPSAWEAMPIGVLEALACGVPQVVTRVGGTAEAITAETGVLVPPHDPEAIANAVVELLTDAPRRERMAAASRARHAERFSIERVVTETASVYRAVLR